MRAAVAFATIVVIGCSGGAPSENVAPSSASAAGDTTCGRTGDCLALSNDDVTLASVNACADGGDAAPAVETWMCHVRYCAGELSGRARCVAAHPVAPSSALDDRPDTPGDCAACLRSSVARWLGRRCDATDPACKADDCDAADAYCRTH